MKPVEGVHATGAPWHVAMRFGALPQILSNFVSYALLRFEINVRGATIIGFVGAGGIGLDLIVAIRKFYYFRRQRHPGADRAHRDGDRHRLRAMCATA